MFMLLVKYERKYEMNKIIYVCPKCSSLIQDKYLSNKPDILIKECTNSSCDWRHEEEIKIIRVPVGEKIGH